MELQRARSNERVEQLRTQAAQYRQASERLAEELSTESRNNWRRSFEGLLALPKAVALGVACRTLRTGALIERGVEIAGKSAEALQTELSRAKQQLQRAAESPETRYEESTGAAPTSVFGGGRTI